MLFHSNKEWIVLNKMINGKPVRFNQKSIIFNFVFPFVCVIFIICYLISTRGLLYHSVIYPHILIILLVATLVWDVLGTIIELKKSLSENRDDIQQLGDKNNYRGVVLYLVTIVYLIALVYLGYGVATLIYLTFLVYYLGVQTLKEIIIFVVVGFLILYGIFVYVLKLSLPTGLFF